MKFKLAISSVALAAAAFAAPAQADSFSCITNNSFATCSQAVTAITWTKVGDTLTISNAGPYVADRTGPVVTSIYFEAIAPSLGTAVGPKIQYSQDGSTGALPGGNTVLFTEFSSFSPDNPSPTWGINPGESLSFTPVPDLAYRVGIHVQALQGGLSESLVASVSPAPEPETYALMLAGLGLVGFMARRRKLG